jgi:hypothetical protein
MRKAETWEQASRHLLNTVEDCRPQLAFALSHVIRGRLAVSTVAQFGSNLETSRPSF